MSPKATTLGHSAPANLAGQPRAAAVVQPNSRSTGSTPAASHHPSLALIETVESTTEDVRNTLRRVKQDLERLGLGDADLEAIEVVLAECMNNVVEHAYRERPDGRFELKLRLAGESLFCRVEDCGEPMPGLTPPAGRLRDLNVEMEQLPEGGFGWFLIRELTNNLHYRRGDDLNSLSFQIRLGRSGEPPAAQ